MMATTGNFERRKQRLQSGPLNGIDWLEVIPGPEPRLIVNFIQPLPTEGDAYGLAVPPFERIRITGGVHTKELRVLSASYKNKALNLLLDRTGDLSPYTLRLESDALDPVFSHAAFRFGANGPVPTQAPSLATPRSTTTAPLIDYRAKDYAAFRTALLDFAKSRQPNWDDSPADLGTTLLELYAYVGDHLSYYQDAVMNEAWLSTARQRESVRRHARLIGYRMHEGAAARAFVHLRIWPHPSNPTLEAQGVIPADTLVATAPGELEAAVIFNVVHPTRVDQRLNELSLYDWGGGAVYLPQGTTRFDLKGHVPVEPGEYLVLEERVNPQTGRPEDADPNRRQIVQVETVTLMEDPLEAQPLTRITLAPGHALAFDFILTAESEQGAYLADVTAVRGNILPVEHGAPVTQSFDQILIGGDDLSRLRLTEGPLTYRAPLESQDPRAALPRIEVTIQPPTGTPRRWQPLPDLLGAGPFDEAFVVETDNAGRATLRFGDGLYGRRPHPSSQAIARYWVGSGQIGNVGAESITILGENPQTDRAGEPLPWPFTVELVRNPLPASGGVDPEPISQVKDLAPAQIAQRIGRAVTTDDWVAAAKALTGVADAVASFRWTGSWQMVLVTIHPADPLDQIDALCQRVQPALEPLALSGCEVQVKPPTYVHLTFDLLVDVADGHNRFDVEQALEAALGRQGFFHPDHFGFGQPVYLSQLHAAAEAVTGVAAVRLLAVLRDGRPVPAALTTGVIQMGRTEIARVLNDPVYPERGLLRLTMRGGV